MRTRLVLLIAAALFASLGASTLALAVVHLQAGHPPALEGDATWPAGKHPAPAFKLKDQSGRLVSLGSLRGHVVMLTFLDSYCHEICPTIGAELAAVQRAFPQAQQPVIAVVSVNPKRDRASSVRTFAANMGWPGPWHWFMGDRRQLSRVWQAYGVDVRKLRNDVAHSGAVYLIDRSGDERSGYLAPIGVTLLAHDVKALTEKSSSTGLPLLPLMGYLFAASVAAVLVIRLRAEPLPVEARSPATAKLTSRVLGMLTARPATTVLSTAAGVAVLTLAAAELGGVSPAAASPTSQSNTAAGSVSGSVIPVTARKPSPSLQGAQALVPGHKPASIAKEQITFVNFWASWCTPCKQEAPDIARFVRSLPSDVEFVGVDVNDQPEKAVPFLRRYRLDYPMVSDPDGILLRRFGGTGLPTTVVIDSRGRVADALFGPQTTASLRAVLHTVART